MMKKIIVSLITTLLLVSLFTGCWPQPDTPTPPVTPDTPTPPVGDNTLSLYGTDPLTLDPALAGDITSHQFIVQLFNGLVRLDDELDPAPDIAERWQISPDGRTYTFYLRQDVRFHDGRPVTADDVKYSWERACLPVTSSTTAATYLGDIVGVPEVIAGTSDQISGVEVVDEYTLKVTIDTPRSYFLYKMTYPTSYVVDRNNAESGEEWWRMPNGTGPFRLNRWEKNNLLVLERNDLYFGPPAGVKSVVFLLWGGLPMNMYETGEIDIAGVSLHYVDKVTDTTGPFHQQLVVAPELSFYYIGFNHSQPPFDDANVRRAFNLAIDKEKMVSLVFRDMVLPADGILPPGMPGYNPDLITAGFNAAQARELIAASKYGDVANLPPITLTTTGWGGLISPELTAVIDQWRQHLGVEVKVRQLEPERYLYHLKQEKDQMFYMGWLADYPHPQDFLDILFHSRADNNHGEYRNPEVDTLLQTAGTELDWEYSFELYQQAEQIIVDDAACIPLWFGREYILVRPYVSGYDPSPLGYTCLDSIYVADH